MRRHVVEWSGCIVRIVANSSGCTSTRSDNQLIITSCQAQLALLTDLPQSNLFLLVFENGEDGRMNLGLLGRDMVETVVRDPDNWLRVLYYVARRSNVPPVLAIAVVDM
jgi:hypothetical protein